jgi:hypothetical protein
MDVRSIIIIDIAVVGRWIDIAHHASKNSTKAVHTILAPKVQYKTHVNRVI